MSEAGNPNLDDDDFPLPPVSFEFLTVSLKMQAEMHLGLLHFGEEQDQPKANVKAARHAIDMLALIQEKTKGNLTLDEQRLIENALTELRFRYIQIAEASGKSSGQTNQESAAQ